MNESTYQPEKLNLWDRWFNRYRKEIVDRGETFYRRYETWSRDRTNYTRYWVEYRIIDRLTGSVTIKREYLN